MEMTLASAILRAWNEGAAVFHTTGYAFFSMEAHVVCVIVLAIILNHQQNVSDQGETRLYWSRLLLVQVLHCLTGIFRVLADIEIISDSYALPYIITAMNFISSSGICWLAFIYTELSQNSELINTLYKKTISAVPLIINIIILIAAPFFGGCLDATTGMLKIGPLFPFMQGFNLCYLFLAALLALIRRGKMTRYERDITPTAAVYPAVLMIFLMIQIFNWRLTIFCPAVLITNIYVYITYADSLVSVDPLTKIPNRNALIKNLSERLRKLNSSDEESETSLYVFAVDVENLASINSSYGRVEGDKVLIIISNALKKFRAEAHQCYASRYHGDEFMIIAEIQDKDELELFTEHIRNYIGNAATSSGLPYHIRVNIGWAKYEKFTRLETISGLVEEADKTLNDNKEQRRFQNLWDNRY